MTTKGFGAPLLTLLICSVVVAAEHKRPNVVLIIADDLGYADVGFNGCQDIPTPNIDRLAGEGVRCTNGYVSHPFCSPSRAGLITGRYQQRFGHENNPSFLPHDKSVGLPADQLTLADVLSEAGYVSSMIGKWHLGAAEPFHPLNRGFTHMFGFLGGGHQYFPAQLTVAEPSQHSHQYRTKLLRDRVRVDETEYLTDAFSREASAFIDRYYDQPFFLYLSYNAPHTPLQATEKYLARFTGIEDEKRKVYAAMVSAVDDGVGRVLQALQRHKLDERTLIFFVSDNGGPHRVNGSMNYPLRDGKGTVYEGGIRIPLAVRWKGTLSGGIDYDPPVSALDIFSTIAAVCEAEVPTSHQLDGVNLIPYLTGQQQSPPHDTLYWRRGGGQSYAVRRGPTKLSEQRHGQAELYDLSADIGEQNDLSNNSVDSLQQLEALKQAWNSQLVAPKWQNPQRNARRGTTALVQPSAANRDDSPAARVLIMVGPSRHPPGTHEVAAGARLVKYCLENSTNVNRIEAKVSDAWPTDARQLERVSTIVFTGDRFPPETMPDSRRIMSDVGTMMDRGCGIVCLHFATGLGAEDVAEDGDHPLLQWMGGYFATRCPHHQSIAKVWTATIVPAQVEHPILRGWQEFTLLDEPYINNYFGKHGMAKNVTPLATAMLPPEAPRQEVVAWAVMRQDGGRGVGIVMPHFFRSWHVDHLRKLVLNSIVWSAGRRIPEGGVQTSLADLSSFNPQSLEPQPRRK